MSELLLFKDMILQYVCVGALMSVVDQLVTQRSPLPRMCVHVYFHPHITSQISSLTVWLLLPVGHLTRYGHSLAE